MNWAGPSPIILGWAGLANPFTMGSPLFTCNVNSGEENAEEEEEEERERE
jgi:hypothetical protein